jgi:hypothetical protein
LIPLLLYLRKKLLWNNIALPLKLGTMEYF